MAVGKKDFDPYLLGNQVRAKKHTGSPETAHDDNDANLVWFQTHPPTSIKLDLSFFWTVLALYLIGLKSICALWVQCNLVTPTTKAPLALHHCFGNFSFVIRVWGLLWGLLHIVSPFTVFVFGCGPYLVMLRVFYWLCVQESLLVRLKGHLGVLGIKPRSADARQAPYLIQLPLPCFLYYLSDLDDLLLSFMCVEPCGPAVTQCR